MSRRVVRTPVVQDGEKTVSSSQWLSFCTSFFRCAMRTFAVIWQCMRTLWYWIERIFLILLLVWLTWGLAWWTSQSPSLHRDWEDQDAVLPVITWTGDTFTIRNIRDHLWTSDKAFSPRYYDDTFDLGKIEKVYYIITPFSDTDGPAHTMLSFSFSWGQNVVISAELRKERGEGFDALKGIMNQFEIQYVIASEADVIKLRTDYRKNQVYMYPIDTPKEKIQALFRSMMIRADKLTREPEFYNTLWNNCTTTILQHANALRTEKLPWTKYVILPAHSDELVYGAGLIDTDLSLTEARTYYRIDELARAAGTGVIFSEVIRKERR